MKLLALLISTIILTASSAPAPFSEVHKALNAEQTKEVRQVIKDNLDNPKSDLKTALNTWVATLPKNIQDLVQKERTRIQDTLKTAADKAKKLSTDAQKVYNDIEAVRTDDSISIRESASKITQLYKKADAKVQKELKDADLLSIGDPHNSF